MSINIVIVNPQIPQNTGSIARMTAACKCELHLIKPMAFEINDKNVKRAGLDYWPEVNLSIHDSWDEFLAVTSATSSKLWLFTTKTTKPYYEANFSVGDFLVFGAETTGIPVEIRNQYPSQCVNIPMDNPNVRSLNLATSAGIGLFEARRQIASSK